MCIDISSNYNMTVLPILHALKLLKPNYLAHGFTTLNKQNMTLFKKK